MAKKWPDFFGEWWVSNWRFMVRFGELSVSWIETEATAIQSEIHVIICPLQMTYPRHAMQ